MLDPWVVGAFATIVTAALTAGASYAAVHVSRRDSETSATDVVTDAAVALIEPLKDRLTELETKVKELEFDLMQSEKERNLLHRWALALQSQLLGASITPVTVAEIKRLDPV